MRRIAIAVLFIASTPLLTSAQQLPATTPPSAQVPATATPPVLPVLSPEGRGQQQPPATLPPSPATAPPQGRGQPQPGIVPMIPAPSNRAGLDRNLLLGNIRLDVSINDSLTADAQSRKSVSMLVLDGRSGQIRSAGGNGVINVDATPTLRLDGKIILSIVLEYQPELSTQQVQQAGSNFRTSFNESLTVLLVEGKSTLISQSADPRGDRKVSVEVTATVVR